MRLIDLLKSDLDSFKENGYAKAVFAKKDPSLPDSAKLSHAEILQKVKETEVKLEKYPNIFDNPGWVFIGSTAALKTAMLECQIEDIEAEFEGFCSYMDW
jgi:hypothetical protein